MSSKIRDSLSFSLSAIHKKTLKSSIDNVKIVLETRTSTLRAGVNEGASFWQITRNSIYGILKTQEDPKFSSWF